jgi:hypothetical protein
LVADLYSTHGLTFDIRGAYRYVSRGVSEAMLRPV